MPPGQTLSLRAKTSTTQIIALHNLYIHDLFGLKQRSFNLNFKIKLTLQGCLGHPSESLSESFRSIKSLKCEFDIGISHLSQLSQIGLQSILIRNCCCHQGPLQCNAWIEIAIPCNAGIFPVELKSLPARCSHVLPASTRHTRHH